MAIIPARIARPPERLNGNRDQATWSELAGACGKACTGLGKLLGSWSFGELWQATRNVRGKYQSLDIPALSETSWGLPGPVSKVSFELVQLVF